MINAFPYPGGKTTYCKKIIQHFPEHKKYIEPFGGSAAVLLNKPRSSIEVYNDLDGDVVHFFDIVREQPEELEEWLSDVPYSRELYERWVSQFYNGERPQDDIERAGRWFYLRYTQFNSCLSRRNGFKCSGERNEARSFRKGAEGIGEISDRFGDVTIENQPYHKVMDRYDSEDSLFYLDPPYYDTSSQYYRVGEEFDHSRQVDVLSDVKGYWIVSYDELPAGLEDISSTIGSYTAMYSMSKEDRRQENAELLAMNFDPEEEEEFTEANQSTLSGRW